MSEAAPYTGLTTDMCGVELLMTYPPSDFLSNFPFLLITSGRRNHVTAGNVRPVRQVFAGKILFKWRQFKTFADDHIIERYSSYNYESQIYGNNVIPHLIIQGEGTDQICHCHKGEWKHRQCRVHPYRPTGKRQREIRSDKKCRQTAEPLVPPPYSPIGGKCYRRQHQQPDQRVCRCQ